MAKPWYAGCAGRLLTRVAGREGDGLSRAELLDRLRAVRRRAAAVDALIAALGEARAAGCDLHYMQCLGCELVKSRAPARAA